MEAEKIVPSMRRGCLDGGGRRRSWRVGEGSLVDGFDHPLSRDLAAVEEPAVEALNGVDATLDFAEHEVDFAFG